MAEDQTPQTPQTPPAPPDPPASGGDERVETLPNTPDPALIRVREFSEDDRPRRSQTDG
jgi:hypothetical protein